MTPLAWSDGMSWVAQLGLLTAATQAINHRECERYSNDGEDVD